MGEHSLRGSDKTQHPTPALQGGLGGVWKETRRLLHQHARVLQASAPGAGRVLPDVARASGSLLSALSQVEPGGVSHDLIPLSTLKAASASGLPR